MALGKNSIRGRLIRANALSSVLALLLACAAFLTYQFLTFRRTLVDDLTATSRVLAFNVSAPLLFDDPRAGMASLAALRANPRIRSAVVTRRDGSRFVGYGTLDAATLLPRPSQPSSIAYEFRRDGLVLTVPILSDGAPIGMLTLESSLEDLTRTVRRYLLLTGLTLTIALLASIGLSLRLQRRMAEPITDLTGAARRVSQNRDYSVRVDVPNEEELGLLAGTFNDMLSQIQRQNTELERAVRARDEFLSVASHELKTPLTPLQLQVQVLKRQLESQGAQPLLGRAEMIDRQVRRVAKLVNELLNISRLGVRKLELNYEQIDLSELVADVVATYRAEAVRGGCELTVTSQGPVVGLWDRSSLEQVLVNLLANALKYGAGRPVEVTMGQASGTAVLSVRDHGIGIRKEDQSRIFDRFERAVSGRHYGGFGLGLWIVRETLNCLGGAIRVESEPGQGATFSVELPLEPPQWRSDTTLEPLPP